MTFELQYTDIDMPVTYEFVDRDHIPANVKLDSISKINAIEV